jgi:hypothetical protein
VLWKAKQGSELPTTHWPEKIKLQLVVEYKNRLECCHDCDPFKKLPISQHSVDPV